MNPTDPERDDYADEPAPPEPAWRSDRCVLLILGVVFVVLAIRWALIRS